MFWIDVMVDVNWYNDEFFAVLIRRVIWHLLMHWPVGWYVELSCCLTLVNFKLCNDELSDKWNRIKRNRCPTYLIYLLTFDHFKKTTEQLKKSPNQFIKLSHELNESKGQFFKPLNQFNKSSEDFIPSLKVFWQIVEFFKGVLIQNEKALINDRARISKVSLKFCIPTIYDFTIIYP